MICAEHIYKSFNGVSALTDLNLRVQKGSIYGLIGVNGAGKTTIINLLSGIYKADSGSITLHGEPVYDNASAKRRIRLIADSPWFASGSTLSAQAAFQSRVYPNWDQEKFDAALKALGLDCRKSLHTFSKGMKKQAAFALSLAARPDLLLLDEPFDGLDPIVRKRIRDLLLEETARRQMSILISSHNLRELENMCDTVGILSGGSMKAEKDLDEIKRDIHKVQVAFEDGSAADRISKNLHIIHRQKIGSLENWIIKEPAGKMEEIISRENPKLFDVLPMTLEEIFVYELGGDCNEYKEILL